MNSLIFSSIVTLAVVIYLWLKRKRRESILIFLFCSFCTMITLYFFEIIAKRYQIFNGKGEIEMNVTGQVGDFIGGIIGTLVAAVSIILLYKTLTAQRESSNSQASEFIKTQNENRFFELLRLHRDNVTEIEFEYSEYAKSEVKVVKARHFFVIVNKQLEFAFQEFDAFVSYNNTSINDIYENDYLAKLHSNETLKNRGIDNYFLLAKIDICYLVMFFGVSKRGTSEIIQFLSEKYNLFFLNNVLEFFAMKPSKSSKHFKTWQNLWSAEEFFNHFIPILQEREDRKNNDVPNDLSNYGNNETAYYPNNYIKYYGGHRFRLGHYYRHLYQLVCFIHLNEDLSLEEKKTYTRIIRGQLSDYEQILFFYNSISHLGRVWELSNNHSEAINSKDHLISNYNLVKNISKIPLVNEIYTKYFYPRN